MCLCSEELHTHAYHMQTHNVYVQIMSWGVYYTDVNVFSLTSFQLFPKETPVCICLGSRDTGYYIILYYIRNCTLCLIVHHSMSGLTIS